MDKEGKKTTEATCTECKYIFLCAFAVLLGFFIVTYLLRGDRLTTSIPSPSTALISTGTAR